MDTFEAILAIIDPRYIDDAIIEEERLKSLKDHYNIIVRLKPSLFNGNASEVKAILCKVFDSYVRFQPLDKNIPEEKQHRVNIEDIGNSVDFLNNEISKLFNFEVFGCCSRYIACSDAKSCTHEDLFFASACMYRKHLEAGRIFYGTNRNID